MRKILIFIYLILSFSQGKGQNTIIGDGFGGRSWYKPSNFRAYSYGGFSICGEDRKLYGWGYYGTGVVDKSPTGKRGKTYGGWIKYTPIHSHNLSNVKYVSAGYAAAVIKTNDSAYVWDQENYPTGILDSVSFVNAGTYTIALIRKDGSVWVSYFDILRKKYIKKSFPSIKNAKRVSVGEIGDYIYIFVLTDKKVVHLIYQPISTSPLIFQLPESFNDIIDIKASSEELLALKSNGQVVCAYYANISSSKTPIIPFSFPIDNVIAISGLNDGHSFLFLTEKGNCFYYKHISYTGPKNITFVDSNVVDILSGELHYYYITSDGIFHQVKSEINYLESIEVFMPKKWDCIQIPAIRFTKKTMCKGNYLELFDKTFTDSDSGLFKIQFNDTLRVLSLRITDTFTFYNKFNICRKFPSEKSRIDTFKYIDSLGNCISKITKINILNTSIRHDKLTSCFGTTIIDHKGVISYKDTNYLDTFKNISGCDSIISTTILYYPSPIYIDTSFIKCKDDNVVFQNRTFSKSGKFNTTTKNTFGCDSIIYSIKILDSSCIPFVFVPDVFTPNEKGPKINNTFQPSLLNYAGFNMKIFNRWGMKIYEIEDLNKGWDGTYMGKPVEDGVYIYQLTVYSTNTGNPYAFSGTITLIR